MTIESGHADVQIFLVTPPDADPERFPGVLAEVLAAAPVAAVLIASGRPGEEAQRIGEALVPVIQQAGAAALVLEDTRIAGRIGADGVQVSSGRSDLAAAIHSFRPRRIVGAAAITSRHAAMEAGELEPDYLFFGKPHGDTFPEPHPRAAELAEWWSELMEIPAVLMAGASLDHLDVVLRTGAAFVGLHRAIWEHPEGPAAALAAAQRALSTAGEAVR